MPSRSAAPYSERFRKSVGALIYCPACSVWRLRPAGSGRAISSNKRRLASTLVSATAVNATKAIPSKNRDLHQALIELGRRASGQVSLSRLQLAIQGLESEHPTARIAVLGLNVPATARRLTRLLLADSSKPQQEWEANLRAEGSEQRQGVVLRFGNPRNEALQAPRSALPILSVHSPVLGNQGIEILLSAVNGQHLEARSNQSIPSEVLLSPMVATPASADGRQSLISLPVHRTLIVARGVDELSRVVEQLARTKFESIFERRLIGVVLDIEGKADNRDSEIIRVDAAKADEGLTAVREAFAKAPEYEKVWTESGMPILSKWLAGSSARSTVGLSLVLRDLITSLVEATAANIVSQAEEAEVIARSKAMTRETRLTLEKAISTFSRQGHTELQSGLAAAWSSHNWRKLAFWKLFWRVDDVPLIVTDLVTTAWLPRTERAVYELTGRLKQAGISASSFSVPVTFSRLQTSAVPSERKIREMTSGAVSHPLILASTATAESVSTPLLPPMRTMTKSGPLPYLTSSLASNISMSRQTFITTALSTLTSSAQQIILKALTITVVSAALSALSFLSVTNGSIYESATIVALGTAYALRRMQREWEAQCKDLEHGLMEEGRSVLKLTEQHMRRLVSDASQVVEDEVEVQARREAIAAVEKARAALSKHK